MNAMMDTPKDPRLKELWIKRRELLIEAAKYSTAIEALQKLCGHPFEEDISRHGTPTYECPDCGNSR